MSAGYRRDVDGLRAVAVLAVVFYHAGLGPFDGGFVGVDIFFVLSGFLITGILQDEITAGTFRYAGFYDRRVRRLFPALFAVLAVSLVLGAVRLLPTDFAAIGRSTLATLALGANVHFWRHSGYFDATAELNPLLHLWSLAVEEQFYLGLPPLLLLLRGRSLGVRRTVFGLLTAVSLGACVLLQARVPTATFFLSPFRAWELLLGGVLAVGGLPLPVRRAPREALAAAGLALIVAAIVATPAGLAFPGWLAVPPVVGTLAVIHAGSGGPTVVGRWLGTAPMVHVGLISYSLYLWHWPLLVHLRYHAGLELPWGGGWIVLAGSLLLAELSYRLIERPFRQAGRFPRRVVFLRAAAGSGVLALAAFLVVRSGGAPSRFAPEVVALDRERTPEIPFFDCIDQPLDAVRARTLCHVGAAGVTPTVLVWGDSHALAWMPAIDGALRARGLAGLFAGRSACPPLLGVANPVNPDCRAHNTEIAALLGERSGIRLVLLAASWTSYAVPDGQYALRDDAGREGNAAVFAPALRATVAWLEERGRHPWLLGPTAGAPANAPLRLALAAREGSGEPPPPRPAPRFRDAAAHFYRVATPLADGGTSLTDPTDWLCDAVACRYVEDGRPLYRDGGHLNVRGAARLEPRLLAELDRALNGPPHGVSP